jgi:hypothetical protein
MKTKNQFVCLAIFVMLLLNIRAKAQFQLINNHADNCSVQISYEAWDKNCGVCSYGVVTISVGTPVTIPVSCTVKDLCVNVISVGGVSQTASHTSMSSACHAGQPNTATGPNPTGCNNNSTTWSTSYNIGAGTWMIQ